MRRAGRAGAAGLGRGGGGEGRSAKVAGAQAASHPPLPLGESVYPPPAWPRHLIGSRGSENWPLQLARVPASSVHTRAGGGGREALAGSGPPQGPAPQRLAPRPCATWQEARAGGRGRAGLSGGAGGARFLLELLPHEGQDEPGLHRALLGVEEGPGARSGRFGGWEQQSIREPQWSRRREGRTLLGGGRGEPQYLSGSSLLPPVF